MNQLLLDDLGQVDLEHLSRSESDHAPLLFSSGLMAGQIYKPFGFLNFWTKKENFKEVVKQN